MLRVRGRILGGNMNKYKSLRKVCLTALLAVLLCCTFIGYSLLGSKKSDATNGVPTSTTVGKIYDFTTSSYNEENLNKLATQVLNAVRPSAVTSATYKDLEKYAKETAGLNGVPIATRNIITLNYGRYRFTSSAHSAYKDLAWLPVYISRSINGDAILTLYLAATAGDNQSTSKQEVGTFANDGHYSTNPDSTMPSNMYGTSYMRAVHLGNNGKYSYYNEAVSNSTSPREYDAKVNESDCNKFNDFIRYYAPADPDKVPPSSVDISCQETGILYDDIAVPAELQWQANESAVDWMVDSDSVVISPYGDYCWPNESYGVPHAGSYYKQVFDYQTKNNYAVWQSDKVWLPSLSEVGNGDIDIDGNDTTNGIWKLTAEKRSNTRNIKSWLRTANVSAPKTGDYSAYTMYGLDDGGNVINIDVSESAGIRPAIHLNLSKIIAGNKTIPPVDLPGTVYSEYVGEFQSMAVIPEDQKKWYVEDEMNISFYFDEECSQSTVPLNAGEYYMMVELKSNSNRYFKGESPGVRSKKTKLVVEKSKIYVKWNYDDPTKLQEPTSVEIDGEFYDKDINAGNVPQISMRYYNSNVSGLYYDEYPDKIGWYYAQAYIIDEEIHKYNYQLVGSDEKPLRSNQFYVDAKKIDLPYFVQNDSTELTLGYKGKQYIQIANASKYVSIEIKALANGNNSAQVEENSQAALAKVKDLGIVDDVQTYSVESVAKYTFTVKLKDPDNTVWKGGIDTSDKTLTLSIEKAEITVSFNGLPSSWGAAQEMSFGIDVVGIYNPGEDDDGVEFNVAYYSANGYTPTTINKDANGKYTIRANTLQMGEYYIYVVMAGSSGYNGNYSMTAPVTQKFTIIQTVSTFNAGLVNWKYDVDGTTSTQSYKYDAHDSEAKALELDYVEGGYYSFYLSISEERLKNDYFVKPEYTGDLSVTDAGLHSITVTIKPYDKNVVFTPQTYTIYFKIKASKFDISEVKWDYTDPFTFNGNEHKVKIDPDTLPAGLSVSYTTGIVSGNGMTNAGIYTTVVTFHVSDEYSKNYVTPDASDSETFINNGTFSFTQQWEIKKLEIEAVWNTDNATSDLFFVPYLKEGHSLVNYSFEKFENGTYVPCTTITSTTSAQKYRVTATVKDANKNNYALTGTTSCEFEVAAGLFAVTVYVEINGVKSDDGAKFTYTGNPFEAVPKISNGSVGIDGFTVEYYTSVDGTKGTKLTSAPTDAGSYIAVITTAFSTSGNASFSNVTEFAFTVEKANLNLSALKWQHTKGDKTVSAWFDTDQKKFIDADGKEAVFAFEYDGTEQRVELVGAENVPGLTLKPVTGNNGINAGSYTAYVSWDYDDKNYNEPDFPKTFNWSITQAQINFDKVKWGYVDADGVEHEFGKDGAHFLLTRTDDKRAVNYTVALINLPSYVKDLFTYKTTSYTDNNFGTQTGSSFSAVGEYHTEVVISGVYNDPSGNIKSFSADDFPQNIVKSMDWEIADRELATPKYDGSWDTFDNKVHNLLDICGVPQDQLNYFKIEVVFVNNSNVIDNNYAGYNGVPYTAFDAGNYIIRFNKLEDAEGEKWFIWGQVELEVKKGELKVTWVQNGDIPVARIKGVYASDKLETKYYIVITKEDGTEMRGAEVDIEYIESTDYAKYEAQPAITEAYANNLTYSMDGESEVFSFVYERFVPDTNTKPIDKPVMAVPSFEYTGSNIQFEISNWGYYSQYLYIIEGEESLSVMDVGVYHISVAFIKGVNAFWTGSTLTDFDRSTYVLEFEVTAPTNMPISFPAFDKVQANHTGSAITFSITNWLVMQDYVEYEVFYRGNSLGKNINLSFTDAGIYTVTFSFPEGSIGSWKDDLDNPKKAYTVQLQIVGDNPELLNPVINNATQTYTGEELTFKIDYWDSANLRVTDCPSGVTVEGDKLKVTNIGVYTIEVSIVTPGITFEDGTTTCTLTITVKAGNNPDIPVPLPKPAFENATANYTGSEIEFKIVGWENSGLSQFLEITRVDCDKEGAPVLVKGGTIKATVAGTYTVTIGFINGANAQWLDTGNRDPVTLTFTIKEAGGNVPTELPTPSFDKPAYEWTGKDIEFVINNWTEYSNYVDYEVFDENNNSLGQNLSPKEVGKYKVILKIKDGVNMTFEGGVKEKTLYFEIKKANLTLKEDENGNPIIKDNKPVFVNGDGVEVDIGDYFEPVYKDPVTGDIVPPDKLEEGKDYDVSFVIKEDKKEEFNNSVSNYEKVTEKLKETYHIKYVPVDKGGLDLIWIIVIVIAVIVVIVLITVTAVLLKRRANNDYDDDYDESYDEGYEDEDYEDEDYEDYDEEDYEDYDDYDDYDDEDY